MKQQSLKQLTPSTFQDVYSLSYRKVCRFYGEALLKSQRTRDIAYDIDTFLNDWQKCIPQFLASTLSPTNTTSSSTTNNNNNIVPTLDMLDALYILTDDPGLARKTIHYFPKSQLIASTSTNNNNGGGGGGGNGDAQITIRKRFERLFREKKRWSLDELKPFIDDLVDLGGSGGGDGVKMSASQQQTTAAIAAAYEKRIEALVLKYARVAKNPNGGVSYTSRFTV